MGWLVSRQTKQELVNRIKADMPTVTEWSLVGNHLWCLYPADRDFTGDDYSYKKGDLLIHLFLIKGFGDGEYGYNVFAESSYPYYYTCPLKFLKKGVVLNQEWRDNVMDHHAKKSKRANAKFNVGDIINLVNSNVKSVEVTCTSPLMGMDQKTGIVYRIPKRFLEV